MTTEAELRRIWGANYDKHMDDALDTFDALNSAEQQRIDQNSLADIKALAAMRSEAFTNPKHPNHGAVSAEVHDLFIRVAGDEPPLF